MKQNPTFKSLLIGVCLLSLSAFVFINVKANGALFNPLHNTPFGQTQVENADENDAENVPVPDVTVLGRLWEIAQKVIDKAN